ncbi:uncharacterized protein LOC122395191 [Colletes gigas]|uniref:uncharacterized protein LOC122395191 n=1 Tax=Colletes gigas TaxID=935657 RepID=UPI001C9A5CBC|nr:uncharacterized protein LOC122395191 [Colletes gigas]XP_043248519.1 uncharacterized protein LOC122395191 [Colletes gigas]
MKTSASKRTIGCIGKCTSGLSREELDQITDNINKTLTHPEGKKIFKKYLQARDLRDNLECLELYETCCNYIFEGSRLQSNNGPHLEQLIRNATTVMEMAEDLDGVSRIDKAFLQGFDAALNSNSRTELLGALVDTRDICCDHLKSVHDSFKEYVSEPCPLSK